MIIQNRIFNFYYGLYMRIVYLFVAKYKRNEYCMKSFVVVAIEKALAIND